MILLVCVAALVAAYGAFPPRPLPLTEPLPHPNGYDDFLAAGHMVSGDTPDLKAATEEAIGGFVASNRAALDRAYVGLARRCCVPTEGSVAYMDRHINDLSAAKQIAGALAAQGRLAELENHPAEAATNYLTVIKLGIELERGGVLMDALVAIACESIGATRLAEEVPKLTAGQSDALAREVEKLEAGREPIEKIMEREKAWSRSQQKGIGDMIGGFITRRMIRSGQQKILSKYNKNCQKPLELEVSLAAHAFELEKGRKPEGWSDLVPAYLQSIPLDPGTTNQWAFSLH